MFRQVVSSRLALVPLLGLTTFFPFLRSSSAFFAYGDGARELVCLLELAFVFCALCDRNLRLPDPRTFPDAIRWALGIWVAWSIGATLFSEHEARALVRQSEWFLHALTGGVLWAWLRAHPIHVRSLGAAIPIGFFLVSGLALTELSWGDETPDGKRQIVPGFENIRHYGYYAAVVIAYLTALPAATRASARKTAFAFAGMSACWALLLWSGSRGALGGLVGAVALLWFLKIDPRWKKCAAIVAAAAVLGGGLSLILPRVAPTHGVERILRQSGMRGEIPTHTTKINFLTNGRTLLWSRVAPQTLEHPWFGHGPDGYLHSGARGTNSEQPHNALLQFVFEWGVIGAAAMLVLLFLLLSRVVRAVRASGARASPDLARATQLGALAAVFALGVQSLVDGTLHHAFPLALAVISLAICSQPLCKAEWSPQKTPPRTAYAAVVAILALVFLANTGVMISLSNPQLPEPDAARVKFVRAFPSRVEAVGDGWSVFYWANHWSKSDPQRAIDWLHFGHDHARQPWRFYQLEGRLLMAEGDREAARQHFEEAMDHGFSTTQRDASQAFLDKLNRGSAD